MRVLPLLAALSFVSPAGAALDRAPALNPKLATQAASDPDLAGLPPRSGGSR